MANKIEYSVTIDLENFVKYSNETEEIYHERIKKEAKRKLAYWTSGYLFDPEGKVIKEEIKIKTENG
jgi:hypothetical protein